MALNRYVALAAILIGSTLAMLIGVPGGASACACGEFRGVVVAHGTSPSDVRWRIKATRLTNGGQEEQLLIHFLVGKPEGENGYFLGMPLSVAPKVVLAARSGTGGEEDPEGDISGMAAAKAVELQVKMNDGEVLAVEPALPPRSLRKRFPWLHGLRFFDAFFPASEEPMLVTAFDQSGQVLGRSMKRRGGFDI